MGTGCVAGPRELRNGVQVLHDLLVQFGVGQDRQQLRRPPRHAVVAPALAGAALAQVPCHGQPKGSRQHHDVSRACLRIAVMPTISQYLAQFPAPGSIAAWRVQASFPGRERGDLEGAQYRLPVLTAQPPNLGSVGAKFPCCVPAVQASCNEQVEEPLPGFRQRGRDLLKPVLQQCPPRQRVLHFVTMLADHVGEHRRAFPLSLGLPEPPHESGIGMLPVACGYRRHPHSWPVGPDRQQDATTCVPACPGSMNNFVHA
jgi:hypothetical protein